MNMRVHWPTVRVIMGMGQAEGLRLVPDASFIRNMPAWFITPMFIPGI